MRRDMKFTYKDMNEKQRAVFRKVIVSEIVFKYNSYDPITEDGIYDAAFLFFRGVNFGSPELFVGALRSKTKEFLNMFSPVTSAERDSPVSYSAEESESIRNAMDEGESKLEDLIKRADTDAPDEYVSGVRKSYRTLLKNKIDSLKRTYGNERIISNETVLFLADQLSDNSAKLLIKNPVGLGVSASAALLTRAYMDVKGGKYGV